METDSRHALTSPDQIAQMLGSPPDFVLGKLGDHVDPQAQVFINLAPLIFVATHDGQGRADVSPKGDAPGFVHVVDSTTLLIPERKGNNLADGFHNIVETGRIGMIFVVPGQRETLRLNGTATVSNDPALLERLAAHDKPALLCTIVTVEEVFFHCGKALIRSGIWQSETWNASTESLMVNQTVAALGGDPDLVPVIAATIEENYVDDLY